MPRKYASSQPALDRPRLIPHAGLPGLDGTSRFAYSMEAAGAARDSFKLLPLLPTPLSAAASSPSAVVAAAGGLGALGEGEAAVGGPSAAAGGTTGVQGMAKGWSPTTGAFTAPATEGGGETH